MRKFIENIFRKKAAFSKAQPHKFLFPMKKGEYQDVEFFRQPYQGFQKFSNIPYTIGCLSDKENGYEWGYSGTGPTDFAANILMHFSDHDEGIARAFHIEFRDKFLLNMPKPGGRILKEEVFEFIESMKAAHPKVLQEVRADTALWRSLKNNNG